MSNHLRNTAYSAGPASAKAKMPARESAYRSLLGAGRAFGLFAMASCCVGPAILLSLGFGIAWASRLTVGIVLIFAALAAGFFRAYEKRNRAGGEALNPSSSRDA